MTDLAFIIVLLVMFWFAHKYRKYIQWACFVMVSILVYIGYIKYRGRKTSYSGGNNTNIHVSTPAEMELMRQPVIHTTVEYAPNKWCAVRYAHNEDKTIRYIGTNPAILQLIQADPAKYDDLMNKTMPKDTVPPKAGYTVEQNTGTGQYTQTEISMDQSAIISFMRIYGKPGMRIICSATDAHTNGPHGLLLINTGVSDCMVDIMPNGDGNIYCGLAAPPPLGVAPSITPAYIIRRHT